MRTLYVVLGSALGAPARFAIDQYIQRFTTRPYGIFLVNVLGSFLLGVTFNSAEHTHDLYLAFELKRKAEALINLGVSLGFGLLAAWLGLQIGN